MLKRIGYAIVLWAVPYVSAIALLPLMQRDPEFFKTIMVVEGSAVGAVLAVIYFRDVHDNYLREGIVLAAVWIGMNWLLDLVGLLPFAGLSLSRYVLEIGLRYLAIASLTVAIGAVLQQRRPG